MVLDDIRDYKTGKMRLDVAERSALLDGFTCESVDDRIEQLHESIKGKNPTGVIQRSFKVAELPSVLDRLLNAGDFKNTDCWISQMGFEARNRRATSLLHLNMLFVDIDIDKEAASSDNPKRHQFAKRLKVLTAEQRAECFAMWCLDNNMPAPSLIIHSGGGLHCKWLFDASVPRAAKPVWDAMESHIIARLDASGWPVDLAVRDVSRILRIVGTINQKPEYDADQALVRIAWVNGPSIEQCVRFDFNALADGKQILPFSRAEFRQEKAIWSVWDANRLEALKDTSALSFVHGVTRPNHGIQRLIVADMWHKRLSAIRRLAELRYGAAGVPEGQRNTFTWVAANALAWSCGGNDDYARDLVPVIAEISRSYSAHEIRAAASSITRRIKEDLGQGTGLLKMSNQTFAEKLSITDDEAKQIFGSKALQQEKNWNIGAMGFEKMANLPYQEYKAETKGRQREAAKRTNEIKVAATADQRSQACQMRAEGLTQAAIAKAIGVNQSTIARWLR